MAAHASDENVVASSEDVTVDVLASKLPEAEALPDGFTEGTLEAPELRNLQDPSLSVKAKDERPACQLPQAEALPDGFSDGLEDPSVVSSRDCQVMKDNMIVTDSSPGLMEVDDPTSYFSRLGLGSPSRGGHMVDDMAVSREMSDFSVDLRVDKIAEKMRRFPVPLSEADVSTSDSLPVLPSSEQVNTIEPAVSQNQDRIIQGHRMQEPQPTLKAKVGTCDGKISEASKTRKRRTKEVRVLLDATEKSSDEKLQSLHTKYLQQVSETEQLEKELFLVRMKFLEGNKEREALSAELNKSVLLRQKLESLCRELQRQNKILLDDSKKVATEEQQKRQELSTKFHSTIKDISSKLEEQDDDRIRQIKENEMLREKLKHFTQQYEIREQHFSHQLRTKSLEHQLLEVKLKQQQELFLQEEAKARMYTEQISQLLVTEQDLRSQLALYGDKFEQFQETLTKSNEVFASFKQEMEKMSKTIKTLEKENVSLKKKSQKSDVSIIELLDERSTLKKQLETTGNQKKKLEALCRSLQAERKQQPVVSASGSPQLSQEEDKQET